MTHLEELLVEYYDWKGYIVKYNAKVGRRKQGGWEMELDVVAYEPHQNKILHLEPSLDADTWQRRELRFAKKFGAGRKYVLPELFPWLPADTPIEQRAILISAAPSRRLLAGVRVITVDEQMREIRQAVCARGIAAKSAIPEHFPLLRTIQLVNCGYYRYLKD